MDRKIRFLAVALCAAAVACAAVEPEASWASQVADAADLVARTGPIHSLVAPARAASQVISFLETEAENADIVPEEFGEFISSDDAGQKTAVAKKAVAKAAPKKAAKPAAKAPKKAAAKAKPTAKKAAAKKPTAKKTAKKAGKKPAATKAEKKTEAAIKKVKATMKAKATAIKKDTDKQKVLNKVARQAKIAAGPNDGKVVALKARAAATAKSLAAAAHGPKKPKKWTTKNVHLKKNYKGKLHLPKNFKVPSKKQVKKKIYEATPPGIHTSEEYWKLKQLRTEYKYKKGYDKMREKLLRKELRRHYASKLTRDHMRRKIDTLRRQRALDEYGPGAHYKPFTWGEYDDPGESAHLKEQVNAHAKAKKNVQTTKKEENDIMDGKAAAPSQP